MRFLLRFTIPLIVVLAAAAALTILSERSAPPKLADKVGKRPGQIPNDWFHVQRAFPLDDVPAGAYARALEQARALTDARDAAQGGEASKALAPAWVKAGPSNIGGRITALGSHASASTTLYAGAAEGGVWKSTDSGVTWAPIFDNVGSQSIGAVTVAPWDANFVFVGTGEANGSGDSYDGDGLYMTPDGGEAWFYLGLAETRRIGRVALDPADPNRIYVAAAGALFTKDDNRGVYRTTDAGLTWARTLFVSDSTSAIDVVVEPGTPANVYAAMWERIRRPSQRRVGGVTTGIYKSTDFGATWTRLSSGLPAIASNVGRIGLAASVSVPGTLVAIYADDPGNFLGLFRTTNSGASWTPVNSGPLGGLYGGFGWYFGQVRIDPTNVNRMFALGVPIYRTTNGGTNWSSVGGSMHVDHHDIWIDPSNNTRVFAGNDGGAFRSTNSGGAWTKSLNLPITQYYAITVDPQNPNRRYGGTQDNGTMRTVTGAENDWEEIYGGDGFYCLVDPTNSSVIYAEFQYGGLGKSTDDANSFDDATNGINSGDRRNWSTPVVMDPANSQILYYGTYRVWRTTNAAGNWTSISPDLTNGQGGGNLTFGTVTTIAVAASDASTIYTGTDDGNVWVTQNLGGAWTNVASALPDQWATRVAVDPTNDAIAYVTFSGYRTDEFLPHVFRTTDHGATWADISGNLPEAPANAIIVDPANTASLVLATDVGVFITYDLGASWTPLGNGLPPVVVSDLVFHPASRTLVAGTHGRSMYRITLPASPTGVEPAPQAAFALSLSAPLPNPARERARFELSLSGDQRVDASVHDVSGRRIRDLGAQRHSAGRSLIEWDRADDRGARVAAGVYFLRVAVGSHTASQKVTIID